MGSKADSQKPFMRAMNHVSWYKHLLQNVENSIYEVWLMLWAFQIETINFVYGIMPG